MTVTLINSLGELIRLHRDELLARWREQVRKLPAARDLDTPTLNDHIPGLIDELACVLRAGSDETAEEILIDGSPPVHGRQRLHVGFDVEEVVAEYNVLRRCIHELADENGMIVRGNALHVVNRVLDEAIGLAVQTYATERALEVKAKREEYLSFVVHDLRTPLNAISVASNVLKLRLADRSDDDATQMLAVLQRNAQRLGELIENVLKENAPESVETRTSLQLRPVELWPLVEAAIIDLKPVADTAGTQLVNNVPPGLQARADAELLSRVFQNLITNSIRYTARGRVTIDAQEQEADGVLECRVQDNGSGIPSDLIRRIFDKFATDDDQDGRHGLGLAIVKKFVEAHGGTVTVESKEGVGSTFTFTLPNAS